MKLGNCIATVIVRSQAFDVIAYPSSERKGDVYNFSLEKFFVGCLMSKCRFTNLETNNPAQALFCGVYE